MKSKKTNYILLGLITVWGIVFFWNNDSSNDYAANNTISKIDGKKISSTISKIKKDTTQLLLNYPDPFLKREFKPILNHNNNQVIKTQPKSKIIKVTPPTLPPNIIYKGLIKGEDLKKDLGIIYFEGKTLFVKQNQMVDSLIIELITDTCIFIKNKEKAYEFCK